MINNWKITSEKFFTFGKMDKNNEQIISCHFKYDLSI